MEVIQAETGLGSFPQGSVLTIGNFDGLHQGHQQIIRTAIKLAQEKDVPVAVMTFYPHPVAILHPERTPGVLTPIELKKHLLSQLNIDYFIIITDSYKLLTLSPESFVDDFLMKNIKPSAVVEGSNFNFGYGRSGNIETLKQLGSERGFEVISIEPELIHIPPNQKVVCSSSVIRQQLEKGNVTTAKKLLTRPYRLMGKTIKGRGKGSQLGFPTANIDPLNQTVPDEGVYVGFVSLKDSCEKIISADDKIPAAFSIGRAKTFISDHPLLVEAHLLVEQVGQLYGKYLAMDFIKKIRNQRRFKSEEELSKQISKDCSQAIQILEKEKQGKK